MAGFWESSEYALKENTGAQLTDEVVAAVVGGGALGGGLDTILYGKNADRAGEAALKGAVTGALTHGLAKFSRARDAKSPGPHLR